MKRPYWYTQHLVIVFGMVTLILLIVDMGWINKDISWGYLTEQTLDYLHLSLVILIVVATAGVWYLSRRRMPLTYRHSLDQWVELFHEWVWETDEHNRFTYVSKQFEGITDIPVTDVLGKSLLELSDRWQEDSPQWQQHQNLIQNHQPFRNFPYAIRRADGVVFHLRVSGHPYWDETGTFRGYRGVGTDVTDEVKAIQYKEAVHHCLVKAIQQSTHGIALYDAQDRLVVCNARFGTLTDFPEHLLQPAVTLATHLDAAIEQMAEHLERLASPRTRRALKRYFLARHRCHQPFLMSFRRSEKGPQSDKSWLQVDKQVIEGGETLLLIKDIEPLQIKQDYSFQKASGHTIAQAIIDSLAIGISVYDRDLRLVMYNDKIAQLMELPPEWKTSHPTFEQVIRFNVKRGEYSPGNHEGVLQRIVLAQTGTPYHFEHTRPNGTILDVYGYPMPGGGFVTTYEDITARKRQERALQLSAAVLDNIKEAVLICDAEARIKQVNPAFHTMTGYQPDEVIGKKPDFLCTQPKEITAIYNDIAHGLQQQGRWEGDLWIRQRAGDVVIVWASIVGLKDDTDRWTHGVAVCRDITARKEDEWKLWRKANFDQLTNLPSRGLFMDRVGSGIAYTRRNKKACCAVLFIDLDGFKQVNDQYGHAVGDALLRETANRLSDNVRLSDTAARLSGDEFAVLLMDIGALEQAALTTEKLQAALREPWVFDEGKPALSILCSVGIAVYPYHGQTADTLLRKADEAMYAAKKAGHHGYCLAQLDHSANDEHLEEGTDRDADAPDLWTNEEPDNDPA